VRGGSILVGFIYVDQASSSAYTGSVGKGLETADMKKIFGILVDDINAHGGAAGRKLAPVYHRINLTDTESEIAASSCDAFIHDTRVFAVLSGWSWAPLDRCLQQAGIVQVSTNGLHVTSEYPSLPLSAEPPAIALDRFGRVFASQLVKAGYFTPSPVKLGVLYHDTPQWRSALKELKSVLQASGISVAEEVAVTPPQSETDQGGVASQMQSAVLRFNTRRVTHVVFLERNAYMAGLFGLNAETQGYRPRYGYHSYQPLTNISANLPAAQLRSSVFMGWWPGGDTLAESQYPEAGRACLKLLRSKGVEITTGNQHIQSMQLCESLYFFQSVMNKGGAATAAGFVQGLRGIGTSYAERGTFNVKVDATHRDGAYAVRMGGYDTGCSCFVYRTSVIQL
jgi:hypothetical protein